MFQVRSVQTVLDLRLIFSSFLDVQKRRSWYYLSNVAPLWAGCSAPNMTLEQTAEAVIAYLNRNKVLDFPGGVPVSLEVTGEQWDFPNAWAPTNHLLFEALIGIDHPEARKVALSVAEKTIRAGFDGYSKYGAMFEKVRALAALDHRQKIGLFFKKCQTLDKANILTDRALLGKTY